MKLELHSETLSQKTKSRREGKELKWIQQIFFKKNHFLAGMQQMLSPVRHRAVSTDLEEEGSFCLYRKLSQAALRARGMKKSQRHPNKQDVLWHRPTANICTLPKEAVNKASIQPQGRSSDYKAPETCLHTRETKAIAKNKQTNMTPSEADAEVFQGAHKDT